MYSWQSECDDLSNRPNPILRVPFIFIVRKRAPEYVYKLIRRESSYTLYTLHLRSQTVFLLWLFMRAKPFSTALRQNENRCSHNSSVSIYMSLGNSITHKDVSPLLLWSFNVNVFPTWHPSALSKGRRSDVVIHYVHNKRLLTFQRLYNSYYMRNIVRHSRSILNNTIAL